MEMLGFVGGTGPQGRGLGLRLAQAGHPVLLGSRDPAKAEEAVAKVHGKDPDVDVRGVSNAEACTAADVVFITIPYGGQAAALEDLADAIGDKIVVNCVNALAFDERGPHPVSVAAGSAAEESQQLLPRARVVGAFQNVSATKLLRPPDPIEADVLICGDDEDARAAVAPLVERIPGLHPVDAGPLRLARPIEELTAVLLAVNKRTGGHSSIRLTGLP
jgi:8-hydroxy-5-deazaflavin:NADPH oxidoreductase